LSVLAENKSYSIPILVALQNITLQRGQKQELFWQYPSGALKKHGIKPDVPRMVRRLSNSLIDLRVIEPSVEELKPAAKSNTPQMKRKASSPILQHQPEVRIKSNIRPISNTLLKHQCQNCLKITSHNYASVLNAEAKCQHCNNRIEIHRVPVECGLCLKEQNLFVNDILQESTTPCSNPHCRANLYFPLTGSLNTSI
jgi:hypothetical protein